jgi:two-component system nitrogen regulation response regulator NtrX
MGSRSNEWDEESEAEAASAPQAPARTRGTSLLPVENAIVGESAAIREILREVGRVAPTRATVLIQGESGTGKELVARGIHAQSTRSSRPFLTENCAALNDNVVESELFGHARGAFTGADSHRQGVFQQAHGGTLFLDEIGDLSARAQGKILRALQEGEIRPVGGRETIKVDVRIIAATHRDLRQMLERGEFREDLFYRLHVFTMQIPPLRQRREDIPALVEAFVAELAAREHGGRHFAVSREAMQVLQRYSWPGNVRELRNVIERGLVLCESGVLAISDLPERIIDFALAEPRDGYAEARNAEQRMIESALLRHQGNKARAAAEIGWNRPKLYRRMRRLDIPRAFGGRKQDED